jgi:hypothetical protein
MGSPSRPNDTRVGVITPHRPAVRRASFDRPSTPVAAPTARYARTWFRRELADQGLADGLGPGVGLLSTLQSPYLPTASNWTDASGIAAM